MSAACQMYRALLHHADILVLTGSSGAVGPLAMGYDAMISFVCLLSIQAGRLRAPAMPNTSLVMCTDVLQCASAQAPCHLKAELSHSCTGA